MKKMRKILTVLLAAAMFITCISPSFALESSHTLWPEFTALSDQKYMVTQGFAYFKEIEGGVEFWGDFKYVYLYLPEGAPTVLTVDHFNAGYFVNGTFTDLGKRIEDDRVRGRIEAAVEGPLDYSQEQHWRTYDAFNNRSYMLRVKAATKSSEQPDTRPDVDKLEAFEARLDKLISTMKQFQTIFDEMNSVQNADSIKVGAYQPCFINMICILANQLQVKFDITVRWLDTHKYLVENGGWRNVTREEIIKFWKEYTTTPSDKPSCEEGATISQKELDEIDKYLDNYAPYFLNYVETHRIDEPDIVSFSIGTSFGAVDKENRTVTIRMPEDTDWNNLPNINIVCQGEALANQFAGSLVSGEVLYKVTPGERATGTYYDGNDTTGYGFKKDLSQIWKVVVEKGNPYNYAVSFAITTHDGKVRHADITEGENGANGIIKLNLPVDTALTALTPTVDFAGEGYYFTVDGIKYDAAASIDFTKQVVLVVYNTGFNNLETKYDVYVTAEKSALNDIISYSIDGANGTVDAANATVKIAIPFATDLSNVDAQIEISEFATIAQKPDTLAEGENTYVIRAENGETKTYTVTIERTAASKEKRILSFKYGGYAARIDEAESAIALSLPKGISVRFAPEIKVSEFAAVSPASGEAQDFSKPVKYNVTAQNGSTKAYTVTVTVSGETVVNEYKSRMEEIVGNIIARYRTKAADDWEWMDLGFYENKLENYNSGRDHDFNPAAEIATLDTTTNVAMTELDRTIMMLTARGFDCTKLASYNGGAPMKDSKGNDVDNLIANLYNYSGGYTINGPIFALLALDMGNYTIPEDAIWTRDKLINTILPYSSDMFGIDMIGAVMYSLAPYQDDAVYGERVKKKLDECLDIVLSKMNADYSFGAWGAINSESAAWVMMGLCSMGIDWHTDPRFSDGQGKSALQHWMDNFANVSGGYFHHTTSVTNNALATYEGCYASMWYLNFLKGGGQGNPYYFYYHRFNFSSKLSPDASITAFAIEGQQGVITEGIESTITVTVPEGMPLNGITPNITLAEGAKLVAPMLPITFVAGVKQPFSVMAEDGATVKTYYVTVNYGNVQASGAEIDISSIKLQNSVLSEETILSRNVAAAEDGATEITLGVKPGVNTAKMFIAASISYGATADPVLDGKKPHDLSDWMTFTVTAGDGVTKKVYRIKVEAKAQAEITSFKVKANGTWYEGVIDNIYDSITVSGVDDSGLASTKLETDITFTGKTCQPTSGTAVDFGSAATFTLSGDNTLAGRTYTVTVTNKSGQPIRSSGGDTPTPPSASAQITGFSVLGVEGVIDQTLGTIVVTLPNGTDVTAVAPVVSVPYGCIVSPGSGEVVNLTLPVVYTVTLGTEVRQYTVSIAYQRSISQQLWDEVAKDGNNTVSDHQVSRDPHPLPGGYVGSSSGSGGWTPLP